MSAGTEQSHFPKGARLGPYEIACSIGAGGMGEVFRARDTRLNRDVAVKVLPKEFVADADRLRRFEQEAKTLAALNHPNVLTIHDAGVHEGAPYLVSELLEGKTLREEMNGGALSVRKATEYALQIAHGLAAANSKDVTHRDLKPENIFVTKDGRVKILDFGLAKLKVGTTCRSSSEFGDAQKRLPISADAATIVNTTEPGVVLGTPAYMSPEQVRGEPADHRADIFAFGCVLYEMLSGTRAFRRNTPVESMNAVLNDAPPELSTTHPNIPLALARIVERCLEKQPDNRFQSAKDLAFAIEAARDKGHPAPGGRQHDASMNSRQRQVVFGIAVLVLFAVGVGWWVVHQSGQTPKPGARSPGATNSPATATTSATDQKSIAVLPFVNLSADKNDEYLSDGMTEELLNVLAKVKGLRVPGRSSSFAFKGKNEDGIFRKVGEQLHVATVLEGSVRKAGNQLRITAQLINVADGFQLWSETYDRDMSNIFAIQSDIAGRVAQALKVQVLGTVEQRKQPTESIEAYKWYLQGRQLWERRSTETLTEAIACFTRAIAADPAYALAYSGLADCYAVMPGWIGLSQRETTPKGRDAALKAIKLDDRLGEPHAALGFFKAFYDWDWRGAEADFRRAIELNANYATAHLWFGAMLETQRRFDEALTEYQRAQEIDPLSANIKRCVGFALFETGKEELGVQTLQKLIALDPGFVGGHQFLGLIYLKQGKFSEAIIELEKADKQATRLWGFAYARAGRTNDAQKVLVRLLDLQQQGVNATTVLDIAYVQHGLGNEAQALDGLERAAEERVWRVNELNQWPIWDDLRPHPRAQAILKKMNLVK